MLSRIHTLADVFYDLAVGCAALFAFWTYRARLRHDRSRWAVLLFEKFFESPRYREMRRQIDCSTGTTEAHRVEEMVASEAGEFTDYLNFF